MLEKPGWRWGSTFEARKRSKAEPSPLGCAYVVAAAGDVGLLVVREEQRGRVEVALGHPVAGQLLLHLLAEGVDADLVDQHLDAGPGAVDSQPVLAVEDPEDGLRDLQVVAVVELHEVVERGRHARHDRGAAAHADLHAPDAVALARNEGDVMDAGDRAVLVGGREGGLDLAGHQLRGGVAHEVAHVGAGVRGDVEQLALGDARPRVAGHVADGVAAALPRGQAGVRDDADQLGHLPQRDVMDLDVLAGGDVALVERRVLLHHVREHLQLLGGHAAHRQLDAAHLDVGLALSVHALLEPEADELVLGRLPFEELLGLVVEVVELALDDRNHVAGHVLVDLGVLQRALAALALLVASSRRGSRFHRSKVPKPDRVLTK